MARTLDVTFMIDSTSAERVLRFREEHRLGLPAEVTVDFLLADSVDLDDLVGAWGTLAFGYEGGPRRTFRGVVESITALGTSAVGLEDRSFKYSAHVVSVAALLGGSRESRIFQSMDVRQIVSAVLDSHGIGAERQLWQLRGSYPKRDYCVQYQESALAFVSRLLEGEGIHFYSQFAEDGSERIVFADDSTTAAPIDGDRTLPFRHRSDLHEAVDAAYTLTAAVRTRSGALVLRDYDFEKPKLDLTSRAEADEDRDLAVYDYPGGYDDSGDGARLAGVRLDVARAAAHTLTIDADCTRVSVGRALSLTATGYLESDGDYFVTSVVHDYELRGDDPAAADGPADVHYAARAALVPAAVHYRPPRTTARPRIEGPQTARIVAPPGARPEEIHTDSHGRVKVKFPWDPAEAVDDTVTFWMRTEQLQTSGSMVLPRVGWEVVVDHTGGDPDRPLVGERLYNGEFMPPYALPEGKTRSVVKSYSTPSGGGSNEIRFEDKAGAEEMMIHAQRDTNVTVANDLTTNVGNNETRFVKVDTKTEIAADEKVQVTKGVRVEIGGDQRVTIDGARTVTVNAVSTLDVTGGATTTVQGRQMEMVGNPLEALISLAAERAAEIATAKADHLVEHVQGAVEGAIDQKLGPIHSMAAQAEALGQGMRKAMSGDLGAVPGLLAGAQALPTAAALAAGLVATGEDGAAVPAVDDVHQQASAGVEGAAAMLRAAAGNAIQSGVASARNALTHAAGTAAEGGGDASMGNAGGPSGAVGAVDETDRTKGPGHTTSHVGGAYKEAVSAAKVVLAANGIITNVGGNATRTVGAAQVTLAYEDVAESVVGNKDETALGLVVVARGNESESVTGPRTAMVGGALLDFVSGSRSVSAQAPATFVGAFHKVEAESSITFKCGASAIIIEDGKVTIQSPLVTFAGAKVQSTKAVAEAG